MGRDESVAMISITRQIRGYCQVCFPTDSKLNPQRIETLGIVNIASQVYWITSYLYLKHIYLDLTPLLILNDKITKSRSLTSESTKDDISTFPLLIPIIIRVNPPSSKSKRPYTEVLSYTLCKNLSLAGKYGSK